MTSKIYKLLTKQLKAKIKRELTIKEKSLLMEIAKEYNRELKESISDEIDQLIVSIRVKDA